MGPGMRLQAAGLDQESRSCGWRRWEMGMKEEVRVIMKRKPWSSLRHGVASNLWNNGLWGLAWLLSEPLLGGRLFPHMPFPSSAGSGRAEFSGGRKDS